MSKLKHLMFTLSALLLTLQPVCSEGEQIPTAAANSNGAEPSLRLEFVVSEPLALLRFINGISRQPDEGTAYYDFLIQHHKLGKSDKALIWRYVRMRKYNKSEYELPSGRKLSYHQRLMATACNTRTFDDFFKEAKTYSDPGDFQTLLVVLNHFRPIYEAIIWKPFSPQLMRDMAWFRKNEPLFARPLEPIASLFHSSAGRKQPLKAVLIPAPTEVRKEGNGFHFISSAFSENLDLGVAQSIEIIPPDTIAALNDPRVNNDRTLADNDGLIHEFTHTIWAFRDPEFKKKLIASFQKSNRQFNYDLLNESQASAVASWFYKQIKGKDKPGRWYDNTYVDRYSKAILPVLESFANAGSNAPSLDADEYAQKAADAFDKAFPDWREDPQVMLWRSQIIQSPLSSDTLVDELNDELFVFSGGDHQVRLVKGESWSDKFKNYSSRPGMTTIFLLDPGQIGTLQKHFALSSELVQELDSLVKQNNVSEKAVVKALRSGDRELIFSISSRQPLQKQGVIDFARRGHSAQSNSRHPG